jgi:predicted DNA binding CopG/RHH family protein
MVEEWSVLQSMIHEYTQRQQLLQVAPTYQPYDGFYTCRLNTHLIQDIKAYASEHRLSQSELVTLALQAYLERHR